ncbi:hypothetical protein EGW08_012449 [Elysia chlorotica]|uniref:Uncharacterized protein n=1 Tax=Elysia chlorotica TaxID=188477 RepID=A0A3S0ZIM4_ELYCH|nr:hypothetical protein EGW08_012449 [Elysia chlorotica]
MSKRLLVSSVEVDLDGYHRSRNVSRTRLRRLETKGKIFVGLGSDVVNTAEEKHEDLRKLKSKDEAPKADNAMLAPSSGSPSLNVSYDDLDADEFAGLRFCSQEGSLDKSGDSDGQCEVRWDCYSPQTVKQLKKLRGQYSAEGVKRIVANFNDAHVKPRESSTLRLLPLPGPGPDAPFKEVAAPCRIASRKPRRVTSQKAVQEMILLLQNKIAQKEKESQATRSSSGEVSCDGHAVSVVSAESKDSGGASGGEDCWSDDDLFQDNSFLIEATQNPEKFINTSFDVSSKVPAHSTQSHYLESPLSVEKGPAKAVNAHSGLPEQTVLAHESPHSSFIPPSCAPRKVNYFTKSADQPTPQPKNQTNVNKVPASNHCRQTFKNKNPTQSYQSDRGTNSTSSLGPQTVHGPSSKPNSSYNAKFASSVNKFVNQSSPNSIPSSLAQKTLSNSQHQSRNSSHMKPQFLSEPKVKTPFKKFNSFQGVNNINNPSNRNGSSNTNNQNSFQRTTSFDSFPRAGSVSSSNTSVITSKNCNIKGNKPAPTSNVSTSKPGLSKGSSPPQGATRNSKLVSDTATEDGFDLSLSEDVLQQLLEVDDVFDSQADILASGQPVVNKAVSDLSKRAEAVAGLSPVASSVRGVRSSTPVRLWKQRRSLGEPCSSTPVKLARTSPAQARTSPALTRTSPKQARDEAASGSRSHTDLGSDSGTELFDSFLNEDVYESQILPFLEKLESETSGCPRPGCVEPQSTSPIKCSPEEIEQKRQAALQRRNLRSSQTSQKGSWR